MVYTRKRTVPYPAPRPVLFKNLQSLSCQRSQPTINPSGRARWSGGAFRAPWYAFQFLGPCGPTKPTNRNKARESDAEQICLLTCFAGHPSLISVSPSILRLPTIDPDRWHGIVHESRNIISKTWRRSSSDVPSHCAPDSKKQYVYPQHHMYHANVAPCRHGSGSKAAKAQPIGYPSRQRRRLSRVCQVAVHHHDLHVMAASHFNGFTH
ncbi:unnamed protein product [Fusarium graminearum]|uniref:Uncharacterized protein n=1 Tax=Gibberella zeae TaxID=5518 RepID=A0A9N8RM88_GIBZA|nr:unnamed protein product [Fusarium graminearum]CAF3602775.1 unnamed protein product [Fusarium graminearum]CAG1984813.1 unnamed protein product [Fusarium graminearum]CAG2002429.1 unnamed protein product [Fusarium graminearum]